MKIHPNPHTQNNAMHEGFPSQGENTHPSAHLGSKTPIASKGMEHTVPGHDWDKDGDNY